jgi:hypothetical protein
MAYVPANLDAVRPGVAATSWGTMASNHNELYATAACHVFSDTNTNAETTDRHSTWANNGTILVFKLRMNADNQPLRIMARMKTTNGTYPAQLQAMVGGADTAVGSTSGGSTAYEWVTFDVSLTGSGLDRTVELKLRVTPNSEGSPPVATLDAVMAYIKPAAPGAGVLSSGFISLNSTVVAGSGYPISTELVERVTDGPRRIAVDRPICLLSFADDVRSVRYATSSTVNEIIYCGMLYLPDRMSRDYHISTYQGPPPSGSDTAVSEVVIDGVSTGSITGNGFRSATVTLAGYQQDNTGLQSRLVPFTAYLRSSSGTPVALKTLQIFRSQ